MVSFFWMLWCSPYLFPLAQYSYFYFCEFIEYHTRPNMSRIFLVTCGKWKLFKRKKNIYENIHHHFISKYLTNDAFFFFSTVFELRAHTYVHVKINIQYTTRRRKKKEDISKSGFISCIFFPFYVYFHILILKFT